MIWIFPQIAYFTCNNQLFHESSADIFSRAMGWAQYQKMLEDTVVKT